MQKKENKIGTTLSHYTVECMKTFSVVGTLAIKCEGGINLNFSENICIKRVSSNIRDDFREIDE